MLRSFEARVLCARQAGEGRTDVVLDRTAFYPTGGGQPCDLGSLGGYPILDVLEEGDLVVHRILGSLAEGPVRGEVDWERRLDHRQQHTGQHILSRAFVDTCAANTVGFHLGADRCTIDLHREDLDEEAMDRAERAANIAVMSDLPIVAAWYPDAASVPTPLRREAPAEGPVRVVAVGTFDATPCCGTHCDRSGQVGPIKILRWERKKGGLRIEFVCGARALGDYARSRRFLRAAALALSTDEAGVPARVAALQEEVRTERSRAEQAEGELREGLIERWSAEDPGRPLARDLGPGRADWLAPMAMALAERRGAPMLLASADAGEARVALATPSAGSAHAGNALRAALSPHGGKGGGNERLAQGKLPRARLADFLDAWRRSGAAAAPPQEGDGR